MLNEEVAVLNKEALDTLGALFGDEGPGALAALIDEYLSELDLTLPKMDAAVEERDNNALYVLAHTLKSSSANMGAVSVSTLAQQIEAAARVSEWGHAIEHLNELKAEQPRIRRALDQYRATLVG